MKDIMKSSEHLDKAANLLEKRGWCKNTCAKDKHGNPVDSDSKSAVRWCV